MIRSTIARRLLAGVLLFSACAGQAHADGAGQATTLYDERGKALGGVTNPLVIAPTPSGFPVKTSPGGCSITQTNVTLPAGTSTQLVAAGTPKDLHWQVTGANPMTVSAGTAAAVVNQGINYQGSTGTGQGGGAENFSGSSVPTNAFQAISAAGTTATVWGCY